MGYVGDWTGGVVTSPNPLSLVIESNPVPDDGLEEALVAGADIGILGIGLATRRHNRVNGRIVDNVSMLSSSVWSSPLGTAPRYIR